MNGLRIGKSSPTFSFFPIIFCFLAIQPIGNVVLRKNPNVGQLCNLSSFERCLETIKEIIENDELAFASTVEDLNNACRRLQDGVQCADRHMNRCTTGNQKTVFEEVVTGTRNVISRLCKPGKMQTDYLRFAACYKNISTENEVCTQWLKTVQKISPETRSEEDVNEGLRKFCCAFSKSVQCQVNHVRRGCGEEAVRFFRSHLENMSEPLIQQHCASFTYGTDRCIFKSNTSRPSTLKCGFGIQSGLWLFALQIMRMRKSSAFA